VEKQKTGKINQLQRLLPEGLVVDAGWLERHGYPSPLRNRYVNSGWLEQIARSVYRRPHGALKLGGEDQELHWHAVVISLQTLLEHPLIVGGRTALELQGFAHYLTSSGPREIHLYGEKRPPGWLDKLPLETRFVFHNAKRLFKEEAIPHALGSLPVSQSSFTQQPWGQWDWPLTISTPERAILELLDEVPRRETFHQADMLMEGLRTLSPRRLHKLLVDCRSVKVKRLFLWFAERHNHAWLKLLDHRGIDLGAGKRVLARGGKLDPHYQITVPENLNASG
jgi:hypothetical protein